MVAGLGAQVLAKPPPARGSVTQVLISPNAPTPYPMGEGYFAGVLRHDAAYGPTTNKIPNPYRFMVVSYGGGGPHESITPQVDLQPVSGWYAGFLSTSVRLGACPDSAVTPKWTGAPGWSAAHKLSGHGAIGWSLKFDKDGKRFAGGVPVLGAHGKWTKVYDPRKDDTQPGGMGPHRLGDETTYEYSDNPAVHAGTYAFGRYQNGKRVLGVGLPADGIDWGVVAAWANVCDANGWTMFGVVYEPGDRWANLRDICLAGGGEPVNGGKLTFRYSAPVVPLDTITAADLVDEARSVTAMPTWRDRLNTVVPQYRSPAHNWEIVDAEPVVNPTFLDDDGEEKRETWPFNFVTKAEQAAQLAAYRLFDTREVNPITLPLHPRLRHYRPGECLRIDLPELGLDTLAIIRRREFDPATLVVKLELMGETPAKHAYCLGQTATPPPTPAIGQTAQERDEVAAAINTPAGLSTLAISVSYPTGLAGKITQTVENGNVTVSIPAHTRIYGDGSEVAVNSGTLTLPTSTAINIYYDDPARAGGAVSYQTTEVAADAYFSAEHPDRHYVATIRTVDADGSGGETSGSSPPGGGGWRGNEPSTNIP